MIKEICDQNQCVDTENVVKTWCPPYFVKHPKFIPGVHATPTTVGPDAFARHTPQKGHWRLSSWYRGYRFGDSALRPISTTE